MFIIYVSLLAIAAQYVAEGLPCSYAVLNFTDADFKDRIVQMPTLCLFYVNWCSYCKALMPQYIKAAESLVNDPTVALARVECYSNYNTCVAVCVRGQNQTAYNSAQSEDAIVKWVKGNILPTYILVKIEVELENLNTGRKFALIGRFTSEQSPVLKVLKGSFDL
ncbi:MAG: hypothetical protein EZS28_007436 [Streblomastix strix]|uniref:Thioredoxin domain-containing protein n=1 Tax=Streblomastix strix TaxID=222440 RepID=A0A5J4WQ03_9EUKA|nr:MAG: hypothetical protein EZS28_007436 [Streblomastix strix]